MLCAEDLNSKKNNSLIKPEKVTVCYQLQRSKTTFSELCNRGMLNSEAQQELKALNLLEESAKIIIQSGLSRCAHDNEIQDGDEASNYFYIVKCMNV